MRARDPALWGTLAALLVSPLIAGCGGHAAAPASGQRLVTYVTSVNTLERRLAKPLRAVTRVDTQLGSTSAGATRAHAAALGAALARIDTLRAALARLPAPARAARLRALLLRLASQQATLVGQTAKLVAFLPAFTAALRPLHGATARLQRALAVNTASGPSAVQAAYSAKAQALRRFRSEVDGILRRLRRLHPPRVSVPGWTAQIKGLTGMGRSAGRLANALAAGQTSELPSLLQSFDRAAAHSQSGAVRRAQLAAIKSYRAQTKRLTTLTVAADRERARLAATLNK